MDDKLKCSCGTDHIVSVNVIPFHGQFFSSFAVIWHRDTRTRLTGMTRLSCTHAQLVL